MSDKFDDLPSHVIDDLTEWYNQNELSDSNKELLAALYHAGKFHAWNCPECGERVCHGAPDDWGKFQGVNQPDYSSFPGDPDRYAPEYLSEMCDDCRMAGTGVSFKDLPPQY